MSPDPMNLFYLGLQNFLDADFTCSPGPFLPAAGARNRVEEEKVRMLFMTTSAFWLGTSKNPAIKDRLQGVLNATIDPQKWETLASIIWGVGGFGPAMVGKFDPGRFDPNQTPLQLHQTEAPATLPHESK